ncbi:sensor histidine kinase [Actinomadura scrupuli]|uniref:sensor histidine kinase n=1 Tax=Actinomadura scrupuli TaxID=559629 RepID=UPI003D959474
MGRFLLVVIVVLADTVLLVPERMAALPVWVIPIHALAIVLVMTLGSRTPAAVFVAAVAVACLTTGSYGLLLWAAYRAGDQAASRRGAAAVVCGSLAYAAARLADTGTGRIALANLFATGAVFVVLPYVIGRYLAQHRRLVSALHRHNRQLRLERELLTERERLRERLRIARDMHDSLGHRLSLLSVQAAALEVSDLPAEQGQAVSRLAGSARAAIDELHDLVGALRRQDEHDPLSPGLDGIDEVVAGFRAAGLPVTLLRRGRPAPLRVSAGQAAYRVVEEGLTNAAKHACGEPVTVSLEWELDALLVNVCNDLPGGAAAAAGLADGHGLTGLRERVRLAGGLLEVTCSAAGFRLAAMLPLAGDDEDLSPAGPGGSPPVERFRTAALVAAAIAMVLLLVPLGMGRA